MHRNVRARRRFPSGDPFFHLGFHRVWMADDTVNNGSVTLRWDNYMGPSLPLFRQGVAGQGVAKRSTALGERRSVAFTPAALGYGNVEILPAAPTAVSMVAVGRYAATGVGMSALTTAGTINTGISQLHLTGAVNTRKVASDVAVAVAAPVTVIHVGVWDNASNVRNYTNSRTAVSASIGGAVAGNVIHLGCLSSNNLLVLNGELALVGYALGALTAADAAFLLDALGDFYGIAISP